MKNSRFQYIKDNYKQKGVATLVIVAILTVVFISISTAIAQSNLMNFQILETMKNARHSYYFAETGIEDTIIQLEENLSFSGSPSGRTTPIGTYSSNIDSLGDDYTITAWAPTADTDRQVNMYMTLTYDVAEVTTKATYMADFFVIHGEGARIRGDVWTNDDFDVIEHGVVEGNLTAIGKGSFATNWVWDGIVGGDPTLDGGEILDNPDTPEPDGNIEAADDVRVSGPSARVQGDVTSNGYVWEMFGGDIEGTITEYASLEWEEIPVPNFDFEEYEQQAVAKGTYFSNSNSFENYVNSLDDGSERRLPEDIYYVDNGTVKIETGSPVYIDGLLVVEDTLYIYSEWYQNAQDGLPAIVCGKYMHVENKFNFTSWNYDWAGPVHINGIVFAEKDVQMFRSFSDEEIIIEGAVWAGDDVYILEHTYVHYNLDPLNVQGFDFVTGISGLTLHYWEEVI